MTPGKKLKALREESIPKLTVPEAAEMLNLDSSNYNKYEKGTKLPSFGTLCKAAMEFKVDLDYFVNNDTVLQAKLFYERKGVLKDLYKIAKSDSVFEVMKRTIDALVLQDRVTQPKKENEYEINPELVQAYISKKKSKNSATSELTN